jgi:hypothetical protein
LKRPDNTKHLGKESHLIGEIALKMLITVVIIAVIGSLVVSVITLWSSQVDPWKTIISFFARSAPQTEIVVTRDPNGIYQDGELVGRVVGEVVEETDTITFEYLADTINLDRGRPFQYQRETLSIKNFAMEAGIAPVRGLGTLQDVLIEVLCNRVR